MVCLVGPNADQGLEGVTLPVVRLGSDTCQMMMASQRPRCRQEPSSHAREITAT